LSIDCCRSLSTTSSSSSHSSSEWSSCFRLTSAEVVSTGCSGDDVSSSVVDGIDVVRTSFGRCVSRILVVFSPMTLAARMTYVR
jgi:hypothetical protein